MDTAVILGRFAATVTDARVLAVCVIVVGLLPYIALSIPLSGAIASYILFRAKSDMAPILGIPGPNFVDAARDFVSICILAGAVALLKLGINRLLRSGK